jgi:predicted Fe-Mo cluster-binding NifX family protein/predicted DNA-binding protein (UPF0251 family)
MPRNPSRKIIRSTPIVRAFLPSKLELCLGQSGILLSIEEWEALRLVDYAGTEQSVAAESMDISRQSVQMLLASARSKVARALVEGQCLLIQGNPPQIETIDSQRKLKMKIAVTCENEEVFPHFGRTPEFYIVNVEDGKIASEEFLAAPAQGHGALVGFLAEQGVETLICGGIGGGAVNSFRAAGIQIYAGASGRVKAQVLSLLSGQLPQQGDANCDHHGEEHRHHEHGEGGCGHHHD